MEVHWATSLVMQAWDSKIVCRGMYDVIERNESYQQKSSTIAKTRNMKGIVKKPTL